MAVLVKWVLVLFGVFAQCSATSSFITRKGSDAACWCHKYASLIREIFTVNIEAAFVTSLGISGGIINTGKSVWTE